MAAPRRFELLMLDVGGPAVSTTEARIYPPLTLLSQGHGGVHRKRYVWRPGKDSNFRRRCRRPSTVPRPGRCKVPTSWSYLDEAESEAPRWDLHPGLRNIGAEEGTSNPSCQRWQRRIPPWDPRMFGCGRKNRTFIYRLSAGCTGHRAVPQLYGRNDRI